MGQEQSSNAYNLSGMVSDALHSLEHLLGMPEFASEKSNIMEVKHHMEGMEANIQALNNLLKKNRDELANANKKLQEYEPSVRRIAVVVRRMLCTASSMSDRDDNETLMRSQSCPFFFIFICNFFGSLVDEDLLVCICPVCIILHV